MKLEFTLNGAKRSIETDADRPLLEVLREDLGLTGTKYGCGEGQCRACTVLIDGTPTSSCITDASEIAGKEVRTIEGVADDDVLHAVQRAVLEAEAAQCGYCVPGMIMTVIGLLGESSQPTDNEIIAALEGNVCRCCNYIHVLEAARLACGRKEGER